MTVAPHVLVLAHLLQRQVVYLEQPGLFKVGRGNTPAALEVAVEAVAEHVAQSSPGLGQRLVLHMWIAGIQLQRQAERIEDLLRQVFVAQALLARVAHGPV